MSNLTAIFEDYIENYVLGYYGCDFEEGWSKNIDFEFDTQEYHCIFTGHFYVSNYSYDSGSWEKYIEPESHGKVNVTGEVFYSPKDFDDENEKSENINFIIDW